MSLNAVGEGDGAAPGTNGNGHISRRTKLDDLPELITVEELAAWLGIGRGTAYELIRRGDVRSVRLGRLLRVPKCGLAELTTIVSES